MACSGPYRRVAGGLLRRPLWRRRAAERHVSRARRCCVEVGGQRTSRSLPRRSSACFLRFCKRGVGMGKSMLIARCAQQLGWGGAGHCRRRRRPAPAAHLSIQVSQLLPRHQSDWALAPAGCKWRGGLCRGGEPGLRRLALLRHRAVTWSRAAC